MAYGDGVFVAVSFDSSDAAYSTDGGQTWTASTLPSSEDWYGVAYGDGVFVAVSFDSSNAAYSTDGGQTWTASTTLPTSSENWFDVAYGNGVFVAVSNSDVAAYSTDGGQTWTASTLPTKKSLDSIKDKATSLRSEF